MFIKFIAKKLTFCIDGEQQVKEVKGRCWWLLPSWK